MKILILDNYDSFTYNIVQIVREIPGTEVDVVRNDKISVGEIEQYDKIILSPGPGIPSEAGVLLETIRTYGSRKPILGICLGEQAIGEAYGAKLCNLDSVYHGIASEVEIVGKDYLFDGLENRFVVGRYHSWVVENEKLPSCLEVTAKSKEGLIMALRHKEYDVHGVQFHPESVLTPQGSRMIENFINK